MPKKYSVEALWPLYLSDFLFTLTFYGFRAIIILYMVDTLEIDSQLAFKGYGISQVLLSFSILLFSLIGDLLLGDKKTIQLGIILSITGLVFLSFGHLYLLGISPGM